MGAAVGTVKKLTIFLRLFLPLFAIVDLSQHVARLLLAVLDDVAVDVLRCGDFRVTEHLGDRNNVSSLYDHNGSGGVPKGVRVDVRQTVTLRKLTQPLGDAVRSHRLSVILLEDVVVLLPAVAHHQALLLLRNAQLLEQCKRFVRQRDVAPIAGLGRASV